MSDSEYKLFVAISEFAHGKIFSREGIEDVRQARQMRLVVINLEDEKVVQWID